MEEPEEDVIRSLKAMFDLPSRWKKFEDSQAVGRAAAAAASDCCVWASLPSPFTARADNEIHRQSQVNGVVLATTTGMTCAPYQILPSHAS